MKNGDLIQYEIENFWTQRLGVRKDSHRGESALTGWEYIDADAGEENELFVEAPLTHNKDSGLDDVDPWTSTVILVSAPGAVGKTTLARRIAVKTGAMLVDLARTDSVGESTISGGLARCGIRDLLLEGNASLIVDGLDEARMKVSENSFYAFMKDVAELAKLCKARGCTRPVVLFGRTGAVEDAWIYLQAEQGDPAKEAKMPTTAILEIGYYDEDQAIIFTKKRMEGYFEKKREREKEDYPKSKYSGHQLTQSHKDAARIILDMIKKAMEGDASDDSKASDPQAFLGYAPVLDAVARWVAHYEVTKNIQVLINEIKNDPTKITLSDVAERILKREQEKVVEKFTQDEKDTERLKYSSDEVIFPPTIRSGN